MNALICIWGKKDGLGGKEILDGDLGGENRVNLN